GGGGLADGLRVSAWGLRRRQARRLALARLLGARLLPVPRPASPSLRVGRVGHHQTFWFSFYASADNLAHSNATLPAGRNFTVTALRPIRSAIRAVRTFW